jgi:hypothetical protein
LRLPSKARIEFDVEGQEFEIEFIFSPIIPGKYYRPPDRCYESEGGELVEVYWKNKGKEDWFRDWPPELDDRLQEVALKKAWNVAEEFDPLGE